jgi:hypothetical protein
MSGKNPDPFEEFEFQPLTEGLGFHKKAAGSQLSTKSSAQSAAPASAHAPTQAKSQSISELMASLPPSLDFLDQKTDLTRDPAAADRPKIFQPIAREEFKPTSGSAPGSTGGPVIGNVLPQAGSKAAGFSLTPTAATIAVPTTSSVSSPYRDRMSESFAKSFPRGAKSAAKDTSTQDLVAVPASISAGIVDAMMIAGIATVLLVCILQITKINLIGMLSNAQTDGPTQMNLVLLAISVYHLYMLVSRAFFGASLGEWAFELQLGKNGEQTQPMYPIQVMVRSMVMMFTGFILLPLLSLVFNRDLAKYATGLQLYRRP